MSYGKCRKCGKAPRDWAGLKVFSNKDGTVSLYCDKCLRRIWDGKNYKNL